MSFLAASEHTYVAALERKRRRVARYVRSAFIYNSDYAESNGGFLNHKSAGTLGSHQNLADGRGESRYVADALSHSFDSFLGKRETVEHNVADCAPCLLDVLGVISEDFGCVLNETVSHCEQSLVNLLDRYETELSLCVFCFDK